MARNNAYNSYNQSEGPNIGLIIGVIVGVIVLGIVGYIVYKYVYKKKAFYNSKLIIPYIHDGTIDKMITNSSIPASVSGNEYNINVWIYVSDYGYRKDEDKCVLFKGTVGSNSRLGDASIENKNNHSSNPSIWLLKHKNTLRILTGLDTDYSTSNCENQNQICNTNMDIDKCDIEHFPLQTWVNLNVSLRSNVLDIFMNGALVKSCILKGAPTVNSGDLFISKAGESSKTGFNGYLSRLEYTNKALGYNEIVDRYKKGPTTNI